MPRDQQKYQKALMKKRSKQKATARAHPNRGGASEASLQAIIRNAGSYPLLNCYITSGWQKNKVGLIEVLVCRQQPDGNICFGLYLIDNYCLGVKDALAKVNAPRSMFESKVLTSVFHGGMRGEKCSPELAHQMIYQAIDYAAQFGFEPHRDFALVKNILVPRGELEEPYKLTFGQDGKPFFIAGPYDNAGRILRQLEKTAGPGNYHYVAPMDMF